MLVTGPRSRAFFAFVATGIASVCALDFVFAPRALALGDGRGASAVGSASASAAPATPEPPVSTRAIPPTLPAAARVPTIVARFTSDVKEPIDDAAIRALATAMIEEPNVTIILEGHSDGRGGEEYNHGLSLARAELVKARIVSLGVTASRITTVGLGATRPLREANEADAQAENRRVEVRWVGR